MTVRVIESRNDPTVQVGDVVQIIGKGVPEGLQHCYFKVEAKGNGICLSRPYRDAECTDPIQ